MKHKDQLTWQVTSLELSQKLKSLNVRQRSLFYWEQNLAGAHDSCNHYKDGGFVLCPKKDVRFTEESSANYSAYTCSELGKMLPYRLENYLTISKSEDGIWDCYYRNIGSLQKDFTLSNCLAKMLVYLIKKGLVDV